MLNNAGLSRLLSEAGCCVACLQLRVLSKAELPNLQVLAQFFTAPNIAKDAALRITKARVELMTEPEHLHMVEPSVRGGMTSGFETRYFKAKNRNLPMFKPEEPSTFGFSVDANNL